MTTHDPNMMELGDYVLPWKMGRLSIRRSNPASRDWGEIYMVICENLVKIYKTMILKWWLFKLRFNCRGWRADGYYWE